MTSIRFPVLAVALGVSFTSSGLLQKYFGLVGLLGYAISVLASVIIFLRFRKKIFRLVSGKEYLAGCSLLAFFIGVFAILYPLEDGMGLGKSSDRDQGLNIASTLLVEGDYPYYQKDDFAGPLSVLPGSIIFATPFVSLGNSAYQNIFWLAILMLFLNWYLRDSLLAVALTAACLILSPSALHEFISGGDLLSNGIFCAVLSMWALGEWIEKSPRQWMQVGSSVLLGCALSSRPNFLFLLPMFCALVWNHRGFACAAYAGSLVFGTACFVTLPFYLLNPEGFTPLISRAKIAIIGIPWASHAVIALTLVTSLYAAGISLLKTPKKPLEHFAVWGTVVILCPMVAMVVLTSWASGKPNFGFMVDRFGVMYLPFLLIAAGSFIRDTQTWQSRLR